MKKLTDSNSLKTEMVSSKAAMFITETKIPVSAS